MKMRTRKKECRGREKGWASGSSECHASCSTTALHLVCKTLPHDCLIAQRTLLQMNKDYHENPSLQERIRY